MEKQLIQVITNDPQYQILRDKLVDWSIEENYTGKKSKHVLVRPSLYNETISRVPNGYWQKTILNLYFFDECNIDKIYELFTTVNFSVLGDNQNWETNSRELGIKDNAVLPYTKYTIEYKFLKSLSCIEC